MIRRIDAITAHDSLADLRHITIPTLVLCAEDDILTPPYQARLLAEAIDHAELKILPSGGHGLSETEPDAFNAVTLDFIQKHMPGGPPTRARERASACDARQEFKDARYE